MKLEDENRWILEHIDLETDLGRQVEKYARTTQELGPINSSLCSMCADCRFGVIGCCVDPTLYQRGMPEELLRMQRLEAERVGWQPREPTDRCRYHGERGCVLTLFRPTVCYSHFCEPLIEELAKDYGADRVGEFMGDSKAFYDGPSPKAEPGVAVHHMLTAIASGNRLLERKRAVDSGNNGALSLLGGHMLEQSDDHAVATFTATEQMVDDSGCVTGGILVAMVESTVRCIGANKQVTVREMTAKLLHQPTPGQRLLARVRRMDSRVEGEVCDADGSQQLTLTAVIEQRVKLPVVG